MCVCGELSVGRGEVRETISAGFLETLEAVGMGGGGRRGRGVPWKAAAAAGRPSIQRSIKRLARTARAERNFSLSFPLARVLFPSFVLYID